MTKKPRATVIIGDVKLVLKRRTTTSRGKWDVQRFFWSHYHVVPSWVYHSTMMRGRFDECLDVFHNEHRRLALEAAAKACGVELDQSDQVLTTS